jgi:hypothetical protein
MPKQAAKGPKKTYSSPKLTVHGTVQELTKHVGTSGNSDPAPHTIGHIRTHI